MPSRQVPNNAFDRLCDDVAVLFPFLLVPYVVALVSSAFFEVVRGLLFWPAFHACVALFGLLTLFSIRRRGARQLMGDVLARAGRLRTLHFFKAAVIVAFVAWAAHGGADPVSLILVAFGGAVLLFPSIDERLPAILAAITLILIPTLQLMGATSAAAWMAVYAFDSLVIVVLSALVRVVRLHQKGDLSTVS